MLYSFYKLRLLRLLFSVDSLIFQLKYLYASVHILDDGNGIIDSSSPLVCG
jgi:hypothetical protein